ncbi:hypothetical protein ACF0H5_000931 [Mactra antiquata]
MESDNNDDIDSNQELLGEKNEEHEEDEEARRELEEAEESIQLLIDALEDDDDDDSEPGKKKRSIKERGQKVRDSRSANKPSASYIDTNEETVNYYYSHSAMGSINDLKIVIPEQKSVNGKSGKYFKTPTSAGVVNRDKLALKLLKKHKSETGKVICGVVILLFMLGLGSSLIVLAWLLSIKDLYLLGGIFAAGGILFTIVFIINRCKARTENAETDYSVLYKTAMN